MQYYHLYGVQGTDTTITQVTARRECFLNRLATCDYADLLVPSYGPGDGTVPAFSAARHGAGFDYNAPGATLYAFCGKNVRDGANPDGCYAVTGDDTSVAHTNLPATSAVIDTVLAILRGDPPVTAAAVSAQTVGANPARYLTVLGATNLVVADDQGNSTAPLSGDLVGAVPGVENLAATDTTHILTLPADGTYTVTFRATASPLTIESRIARRRRVAIVT